MAGHLARLLVGYFWGPWLGAALALAVAAVSTYGLLVAAAREACRIVFAVASGFLAVACYVLLRWLQYFATRWCGLAVAGRRSQYLAVAGTRH